MNPAEKDYIVIVQCHIVKQRCSGVRCEQAFTGRTGGFAEYPADRSYRTLYMTCGGCCGRAVQRKLTHLARKLRKSEDMAKGRIVVQLSSCITKDNVHSPPCPSLQLIKTVIERAGLDYRCDTHIDEISEAKRAKGIY